MDFITTGVIASAAYEILKHGAKLSASTIKKGLEKWIKDDVIAEALAEELTKLGIDGDLSEAAISRRLDASDTVQALLRSTNGATTIDARSAVGNVSQSHSGSGDNVAGNKITK